MNMPRFSYDPFSTVLPTCIPTALHFITFFVIVLISHLKYCLILTHSTIPVLYLAGVLANRNTTEMSNGFCLDVHYVSFRTQGKGWFLFDSCFSLACVCLIG